jgi:alkaline phosphatase D
VLRSLAGAGGALSALSTRGARAQGAPAQGAPALFTPEAARPSAQWGTAVGDVTAGRATVWSRTDRPARMVVEYATSESFRDARRVVGEAALETSGFTARVELVDVPPDERIAYRVLFQDLRDAKLWSPPLAGSFRSAPAARRDVLFAWSADTVGQGWGINLEWGGLRGYEAVRRAGPDFFVHCGDTIYADGPLLAEVKLDDGTLWRNVVTEAKSKVAETLEEFRGNHLYNLLDDNVRRLAAEVPQVVLWDDHEVHDNWYPSEVLDDPRYRERSVALLAARAKQAFLEHQPVRLCCDDPERIYRSIPYGPSLEVFALDMRSYRGPNSPNRQTTAGDETAILGRAQVEWLQARLVASRATWKVIASDLPLGVVVRDFPSDYEAVANGDPGPPLGRELEIAGLLRFLRDHAVRNVVWITADVHYAAAHHYAPERARFREFLPFWEFVAGPLHAGTFGPNPLDPTFGPERRFLGIPEGMKPNRPPSEGLQFFGTVRIDGRTETMSVRLHNLAGETIYRVDLEPERG